jgi:hypothetical protein
MVMNKNLLLLMLTTMSVSLMGQNPTFPPVTGWEKDSTLVTFINHLRGAVANKDVKYVTSLLDKEVMSAFDGGNDVKSFIENWQLNDDSTMFWQLLSRALEIGGAYVNDPEDETGRYQVVFPYVYNYEPGLEDDAYSLGCIVGKKVNLREKPDTKATVKTQLTYDVISFLYDDEGEIHAGTNPYGNAEWYNVETYNHQFKGWVNWKFVYGINGPRLFLFKNPAGKWHISAFLAGD